MPLTGRGGLANTKVVPEEWSDHHAPVATGGMNATVSIGSPTGEPVYDPETDDTTVSYTEDYLGPARIQALNQNNQTIGAGQVLTGRAYLVQLDKATAMVDFQPGMRVKVTAAINDANLVGQDLWIVDPQYGSERFTRDLVTSDNQTDVPSS